MSLPLLTGCVSQAAAGGGGAVTAAENLVHWWKMNEGSTTAETDYGLAATADTDMVMSGVTSSAGGPTENGTPAMIEFDGVSDDAYVLLVDSGGTPTAIGDIFNSVPNTWSLSVWLKDDSTPNGTYKTWWKGGATWSQGMGVYASGSNQVFWIKSYNGYKVTKTSAVPTSGWRNVVVTFPDVSVTDGYMYIYFDGVEAASFHMGAGAHTVVNTNISSTANTRLSFGCAKAPNGSENYHQACAMSDIRVYNKTLSGAEAAAIAAGDW